MSEKAIQAVVMRRVGSLPNVRLFRNQVGIGWLGKVREHDVPNRIVVLENAYRVSMGLHVGSGDLIGWRKRIITPDDVGKTYAQFLSVEVKQPKGRLSLVQGHWRETVNNWGGIAFETRSAEDAVSILRP